MFSKLIQGRKFLSATGFDKALRWLPWRARLYRFAYRSLCPSGSLLTTVQGIRMYLDPGDVGIARRLLTDGVWEPLQTELFTSRLRRGMVVVDIGANLGYFTLVAADRVGEEGKVFAFEPAPQSFTFLCRSTVVNGFRNVAAIPKAVSDRRGVARLMLSDESSGDHRLCNSGKAEKTIEVETVSLDEFFGNEARKIDVVKVDAEGAEMAILRGMRGVLEANPEMILFTEYFPRAIRAFGDSPNMYLHALARYGFEIARIDEDNRRTVALCLDHLEDFTESLMGAGPGRDSINLLCLRRGNIGYTPVQEGKR